MGKEFISGVVVGSLGWCCVPPPGIWVRSAPLQWVANWACQSALASPGGLRVTLAAAAASPNSTMLSGWRGLSEREVISLLYTSTLRYAPDATRCAAVC